jgi:hypothetical protein
MRLSSPKKLDVVSERICPGESSLYAVNWTIQALQSGYYSPFVWKSLTENFGRPILRQQCLGKLGRSRNRLNTSIVKEEGDESGSV